MEDKITTDYEYKVIEVESNWMGAAEPQALEDALNEETEGEWEYVDNVSAGTPDGVTVLVIFRKPV